MNENQQAAYIMAQAASALIEAMGMMSENMADRNEGWKPYRVEDFRNLTEKYGIGHNAVIGYFRGQY